MSLELAIQIGLAVLSLTPIALAQAKSQKIRRYDCVAGLVAQPFWFAYGWSIDGLALMFLSVVYIGVFAYGIYTKWVLPSRAGESNNTDSPQANKPTGEESAC